ncbi:MAG: NAD-dependent epimerase/dehydratase family protein [Actinobacteria bacterium]|nr:NAD-dependent epimerase/dehydratase family protein [Actinomycetota bacterium]
MKVLVTGGAGFIGANLVERLLAADAIDAVTVVDDLSTGEADRLAGSDGVELWKGSVLDAELLRDAAAGCDAVVHLAALASVPESLEQPVAYHEVNGTGTLHVLDAAREHGCQVIVASSAAVYGQHPPLPASESLPPQPTSVYASSKLAAEAHALAYGNAFDLPVLVFRFFNVFGPLQDVGHTYAAVVPAFVSAAVSGEPLLIFGDGQQTRDMVPVGSVVSVLTDAVVRRMTHTGPVNLAFGTRRSLLDIVAELEQILGRPLDRRHLPPRAGDVRHSQADHRLLRRLFPNLEPPDFTAELAATVDWFQHRRVAASTHIR